MKPKSSSRSPSSTSTPTSHSGRKSRRGRHATSPAQVPLLGWFDVVMRAKAAIQADNLSLIAGGIAFFSFLAAAPALAATIALYALIADPSTVVDHLALLDGIVPPDVMPLLHDQAAKFVSDDAKAGVGLAVGLVLTLYGSAKAARSLILALNIAYGESEHRGLIRLNLLALGFTVAGILAVVALIAILAGLPVLLHHLAIAADTERLLNWARWPILYLGFAAAMSVVYCYGPARRNAQWQWVTWGAVLASSLWLLTSVAFSSYASHFGNYGKSYGALAGVVLFLLWLYLTAYVILLGAELNAEVEHQTAVDSTHGSPKPMGQRGAHVADTLGKTAGQLKQQSTPTASTLEPNDNGKLTDAGPTPRPKRSRSTPRKRQSRK